MALNSNHSHTIFKLFFISGCRRKKCISAIVPVCVFMHFVTGYFNYLKIHSKYLFVILNNCVYRYFITTLFYIGGCSGMDYYLLRHTSLAMPGVRLLWKTSRKNHYHLWRYIFMTSYKGITYYFNSGSKTYYQKFIWICFDCHD